MVSADNIPSTGETARSEDGHRTFWVVERFENGKSAGYWNGGHSRDFVADINEAIQFCRRTDAYWVSRSWRWTDVQLTEHIMLDSSLAPRSEDVAVPRKLLEAVKAKLLIMFDDIAKAQGTPGAIAYNGGASIASLNSQIDRALAAAPRPDARTEAEQRVLAVRGSWDAPGFDACVKAEMARATGDVAAKLAEHTQKMSDALRRVRPLGGSELFVRVGDKFYADPDYCGAEIDRLRSDLREATCENIRLSRATERAAALEQENERLKTALQQSAECILCGSCRNNARRALGETP